MSALGRRPKVLELLDRRIRTPPKSAGEVMMRSSRIKLYRMICVALIVASLIVMVGPRLSYSSMRQPVLTSLGSVYNPIYPYDEQLGMTFTEDFNSLAFNITAVEQTGPEGLGPAYLLNGLSNLGYWYQVGLSWNWLYLSGPGHFQGFRMNYEVFDGAGNSIYPANGSGEDFLGVNAGDIVLLSLYISGNSVMMAAKDWNTGSSTMERYSAQGAGRFVGSPEAETEPNGFFTGLMTEEFHSSQYYGGEQSVSYIGKTSSAAWMWINEFNGVSKKPLFFNSTYSPISLTGSKIHFLSTSGVAETSSEGSFVTGLQAIPSPKLGPNLDGPLYTGSSTNLRIIVTDKGVSPETISNVTVHSDFGNFAPRSGLPFNLTADRSGQVDVSLDVPSTTRVGNHTLSMTVTWVFYNSELSRWVDGSVGERGLVSITTVFYVPVLNAAKNPIFQVGIVAALLAVLGVLIVWKRRRPEQQGVLDSQDVFTNQRPRSSLFHQEY